MRFLWLSNDNNLVNDLKSIKLKVFEDDSLKYEELDIFDFIVKNKFKDFIYNKQFYKDIDYAIVEQQGKHIGIIGYYTDDGINYWLGWAGILKEFRHKGYGLELFKNIEKYLKNKDVKTIRVYTGLEENKNACEIYKKLGYILQNGTFELNGEKDIVIFGKNLDSSNYENWDKEPLW